jgi:hypothetical protein
LASGCAFRCICRRRPSGCAREKLMWAEPNCICWTPTTPPICLRIAVLPVSCMGQARVTAPAGDGIRLGWLETFVRAWDSPRGLPFE